MGFCVLTKCCGMNLHAGMRACLIYVMVTSLLTCLLVILDLVDIRSDSFQMSGTMETEFRIHTNDVMTALDSVMIFAHLFMFCLSIIAFIVSKSEDAKLNVCILTYFAIMQWLYILIELAVNLYFFTWMGRNIFIMPFLTFLWIYWVVRFSLNVLTACMAHSRIIDLKFQKKYDLLNMPGVNHSLSSASMLSSSMRSVAGKEMIKAVSSQRLAASRQSLHQSQRSLNRSQMSLNRSTNI